MDMQYSNDPKLSTLIDVTMWLDEDANLVGKKYGVGAAFDLSKRLREVLNDISDGDAQAAGLTGAHAKLDGIASDAEKLAEAPTGAAGELAMLARNAKRLGRSFAAYKAPPKQPMFRSR